MSFDPLPPLLAQPCRQCGIREHPLKCLCQRLAVTRRYLQTAVGDHLACGSETNEVYVYRKDLASPITSVRFARDLTEPHGFISACTWRDDDLLIAANSNGVVKILRS